MGVSTVRYCAAGDRGLDRGTRYRRTSGNAPNVIICAAILARMVAAVLGSRWTLGRLGQDRGGFAGRRHGHMMRMFTV